MREIVISVIANAIFKVFVYFEGLEFWRLFDFTFPGMKNHNDFRTQIIMNYQ